jgi:dTDP-4-amino-4,6-dideoxygalactose transaminase
MYGCAAAIEDIAACCRDAGVPLVDDAAQVAGVMVNGRPLGTFGEFGITSFAQSKTIVTGVRHSGGLLLINAPALIQAVTQSVAELGESRHRLKQFLYFILLMQLPAALRVDSPHYDRLIELLIPPPVDDHPTKISNLEAAIALRQIDRLPELIRTRVAAIDLVAKTLSDVPGLELPQVAPARFLSRLLVTLPPETDRDQVRRALARSGVQTRLPYRAMFTQAEAADAWELSSRMLELPCHAGLGESAVQLMRSALVTAMAQPGDAVRRSRVSPVRAIP